MTDVNPKYSLKFDKLFTKTFLKNFKTDKILIKALTKTLDSLRFDPFSISLKTHKVDIPDQNAVFSSRITGDWRLIWEFDELDNMVILCLKLGTHGGGNQVYLRKSN